MFIVHIQLSVRRALSVEKAIFQFISDFSVCDHSNLPRACSVAISPFEKTKPIYWKEKLTLIK